MHIEIFSLCDAATTDAGGKLNVLGAFDTIWTANVPLIYPHCAIALRIRFESIETGEHKVVVNFVDLDGRHIIPSATTTINVAVPNNRTISANSVLNLQLLRFERYGEYSIDLAIDGRKEASLPLFLMQMPVGQGRKAE